MEDLLIEAFYGILLSFWVAIVTLYISKVFEKKYSSYVARKVIHILGGGVTGIIILMFFQTPYIPIIASLCVLIGLLIMRIKRTAPWFQESQSRGEIYFAISSLFLFSFMWYIYPEKILSIIPFLYMSIGDGVTGIVRYIFYKKRVKGYIGTIAMIITCVPIGYYLLLPYGLQMVGILSAIIASLVEKVSIIDDNISVPLVSSVILIIGAKIL
ncbi:phosphatidate cytidylyltransferase [Saccharolobus islandicus]|jgi:dolichol kinase|uniref:phosphatidate cytidylyltransferase n=1 Tax=Saccharolobus islandicus TaxID=43080 RepID=UPI00241D13D4|nr:phosphatidate cytidylyltransferase [Sulfolobus islandicus]